MNRTCKGYLKPLAKRLNSPPTASLICIIVPEYTGIPLPLCKHSTYWSQVGKYTSVIFLFKVKHYSQLTRRKWYRSSRAVRYVHLDCGKHMFCQRSLFEYYLNAISPKIPRRGMTLRSGTLESPTSLVCMTSEYTYMASIHLQVHIIFLIFPRTWTVFCRVCEPQEWR